MVELILDEVGLDCGIKCITLKILNINLMLNNKNLLFELLSNIYCILSNGITVGMSWSPAGPRRGFWNNPNEPIHFSSFFSLSGNPCKLEVMLRFCYLDYQPNPIKWSSCIWWIKFEPSSSWNATVLRLQLPLV